MHYRGVAMIRFYKTQAQFEAFYTRLKLTLCPHCKHSGFLILHGYLYGYCEQDNSRIQRGRRVYCSNRNNKNGCGRTFGVVPASVLPKLVISAQSLWRFLHNVKNGHTKACAFRTATCTMAQSSIYRLFKKFLLNQMRIRSFLTRIKDPPAAEHVQSPFIQTILHLKQCFDTAVCPITEFQYHFQAPLFQ